MVHCSSTHNLPFQIHRIREWYFKRMPSVIKIIGSIGLIWAFWSAHLHQKNQQTRFQKWTWIVILWCSSLLNGGSVEKSHYLGVNSSNGILLPQEICCCLQPSNPFVFWLSHRELILRSFVRNSNKNRHTKDFEGVEAVTFFITWQNGGERV